MIKAKHRLADHEVHTAWLLRRYPEQDRIADLDKMSDSERRAGVKRDGEELQEDRCLCPPDPR
jgi:hypothetical protein